MGKRQPKARTIPGLARALAVRGLPSAAARALVHCRGDPARTLAHHSQRPLILIVRDAHAMPRALDAGADDAVVAGAPIEEIAARIAARLRAAHGILAHGELRIDRTTRIVIRAGRRLALHPREYALLLHLAENAGRTVTRAELLDAVWGLGFDPGTNLLNVHVSRLRAKLDHGFARPMLRTEKGVGYRLDAG